MKLIVVACNTATSAALPRAAGGAGGAGDRRDHARGARGRAGDAQPPRSGSSRRRRRSRAAATRRSCARSTRASRLTSVACPRLVPLIESDDPFGAETTDGGARVRRAAQARRRRHGDPRLHALPADPADLPARVRPRRDARLLGRGDRARGGRDARAQGDRERAGARGRLPLPHDRRPRGVPRDGPRASCSSRSARSSTSPSPSSRRRPHERDDGRRPDQLRPLDARCRLPRAAARLGALLAGEARRVLCTASIQEGVPRWLYNQGRGWITASTRCCRRPPATAPTARRRAGSRAGARRDPAADRPLAPRGRRLRGARRAHALARLRRAPGRRRHALRGDLRRVRRGPPRARPLRAQRRRSPARSPRSRSGSSTASRCSTSTTPRTRPPTPT